MATIGAIQVDDSIEKDNISNLESNIDTLVTTIHHVDTMIDELVTAGLKGNAVAKMAETYIENRTKISSLVSSLAASDCDLINYINTNIQIDEDATSKAAGQQA